MIPLAGPDRAIHNLKVVVDDEGTCRAIANFVIDRVEQRQGSPEEAHSLADALGEYLQAFLAWIRADAGGLDQERDGMLKFDWLGVEFLSRIGPSGQERADEVRPVARAAWQKYLHNPIPNEQAVWRWWRVEGDSAPVFALQLAGTIWRDHLRPDQPAAANGEGGSRIAPKFPVLSAVVLRRIFGAFFFDGWKLERVGTETRVVNRRGEFVAVVSADLVDDPERVPAMLKATRSLLGHRLFRHLVQAGVQRHLTVKHHGHRVVIIQGGLSGLATELGIEGSKAATALRLVLDGFKYVALRLPGGKIECLLDWSLEPASPGQRSVLHVTLHDALLPDYVNGLPKTTVADREARRLVPIPAGLPPLVGHPRTHSGQALLQLILLEELNAKGEEIYESGCAKIPWSRWLEVAEEAGVTGEDLSDVFSAMVYGDKAMLKRDPPDGDLYALTDQFEVERYVITKGGEKSAKGRVRQAMAKKKAAKTG